MYATIDGEIVASLRLNLGKDAPFSEELEQTYNLDRFRGAIDDSQMLILTRFMVKSEYRGTSIAHQMICQVAKLSLEEDIEVSFCDCQPHLVRYYQRIGFRSYACDIYNDPEFGIMIPLTFIHGDLAYLASIRSPLKAIFEQRESDTVQVDQCIEALGTPTVTNVTALPDPNRMELLEQLKHQVALFGGARTRRDPYLCLPRPLDTACPRRPTYPKRPNRPDDVCAVIRTPGDARWRPEDRPPLPRSNRR